jgi:hypothetical protein
LSPPLSAAFMPDVPHASSGRSGLFSHTSQPQYSGGPSRCRSRAGTRSGAGPRGRRRTHDLLDQLLAAVVGRVRLAGDDELHRPVGVQQQRLAAARGRAASASAACTTARGGRSRWSARRGRAPSRSSPSSAARARAASHDSRSRGAPPRPAARGPARGAPQLVVAGLVDALPAPRAVASCHSGSPWRSEQVEHLAGHPRRRVHAVGDRPIGTSPRRTPATGREHLAAHLAVQLGDAVGALGQPQAHHRHVERSRRA